MEGSESEAIFDSLNLNPQLFINTALNDVDQLIDDAFDHLHREASTQLSVEGTDRDDDLTKGLNYIRNTIQSDLDKRLAMWEKYCLLRCFVVPEGFILPKDNEASDDKFMDVDSVVNDPDLDVQLDSLRTKLTLANQESVNLKAEIQALERESVLRDHHATSINEALKLCEQISNDDVYKEMQNVATELRANMEKLRTQREDAIQRSTMERLDLRNGDWLMIAGNGLFNAMPEDVEGFLAGLKTH